MGINENKKSPQGGLRDREDGDGGGEAQLGIC